MSVWRMYVIATWLMPLAFALCLAVLAAFFSEPRVWFAFVPFVLVAAFYLRTLRCPKCRRPVGKVQLKAMPLVHWYAPFPPKHCRRCGSSLD